MLLIMREAALGGQLNNTNSYGFGVTIIANDGQVINKRVRVIHSDNRMGSLTMSGELDTMLVGSFACYLEVE